MKKILLLSLRSAVYLFAVIGIVLSLGYGATYFHLTNTVGIIDKQGKHFVAPQKDEYLPFPLAHTSEWRAFKQSIVKDASIIKKVSKETGVPARIIIAIAVPEQMRLFYSDRALFKKVFEPLKILGSQSQFSWGIFGIKDETAREVEAHLRTATSPYYLGKKYENMLDFTSSDIDQERFTRIVDEHDHTYAYLYAALYVAQINAQWEKAGFPINDRPEIIATLWNLGFTKSVPNATANSGGSVLEINGEKYSFGTFAHNFYYSDELIEIFPRE